MNCSVEIGMVEIVQLSEKLMSYKLPFMVTFEFGCGVCTKRTFYGESSFCVQNIGRGWL